MECAGIDPVYVYWTLRFTISSFDGEFAESLVQVRSLTSNFEWKSLRDPDKENKGEGGAGLFGESYWIPVSVDIMSHIRRIDG
jgi:hypothetical protein